MNRKLTRREMITSGAAFASATAMGVFGRGLPALAQGEEVIPWTDQAGAAPRGALDTRTVQPSAFITSTDNFYLVQHYGTPTFDLASYKLHVTGLVNKPMELTLDQLKQRPRVELVAGFECGGNSNNAANRLCGNGKWAGTSLSALLRDAGVQPHGREVVFFGIDKGMEKVTHGRTVTDQEIETHFARSLALEDATKPEVLVCWEMNGAPLTSTHGAPVRLIVPGWYGVANAKWMNRIHVQDTRFTGRFMAREYVTMTVDKVGDETIYHEQSVSRIRIKSIVSRLTRTGTRYTAHGFALNDGTPLKSVEVRVDNGDWKPATLSTSNTQYSWKLFSYEWSNLTPGEHTIVSRATDANGVVQPVDADLAIKKTMWENNSQWVRKFTIT